MRVLQEHSPSLTEQLQRFSGGDRIMAEVILREVLPELHRIAVRALGREHDAPLSPTELINEVWLRNLGKGGWLVTSRQHFYAIAALAMRQVLIDFARIRMAQRRGRAQSAMPLSGIARTKDESTDPEGLIRIGILMDDLERHHPESARVVDMHYFAGFTLDEIVEITGLTFRQVRHRWERGRDWLKDGLRRQI